MYCIKKITDTLTWIGGNDRRLAMFEGVYSVPDGVSYNSYVLDDDKIAVFDTVDRAVSDIYFENLEYVLGDRTPDYLVIHHMEPDHSACMNEFILRYPETKIVCNSKTKTMIGQFFDFDIDSRALVVNEGDVLELGAHRLTFINAPMVHWPEVMMTYEMTDKLLFSADAFGCFGALNGAIFADEVDFERDYMDEARRYYTNIVGKYGVSVQNVLKKVAALEISYVCPLHGFVWRRDFNTFVEKYLLWSSYTPEQNGVVIAYASVYGNTSNAAEILSSELRNRGVQTVMFDVSVTPASEIISAIFKYSHVVLASPTYNTGIFVTMEALVYDIAAHSIQNRTFGFIQNGSWAPTATAHMREILKNLRNTKYIECTGDIRSSLKAESRQGIIAMADEISSSIPKKAEAVCANIDPTAIYKLSYGIFLLTAKGEKHNGCIINTAIQLTGSPIRISIAVNKSNYTNQLIKQSGVFNISVLDETTDFELIKRFGFASGRDTDKFEGFEDCAESANGLKYLTRSANSYMSARVVDSKDYGTHTVFVAELTEAEILGDIPSATYAYYFESIKPKAAEQKTASAEKKIVGWRCKICGYEYEGAELPADFVCPWCKHPAEDFEPIYG